MLHSYVRVLSSSFMRPWSLRAPETVRLASSVLPTLPCSGGLHSCPRSPALDLKDFPSNPINGVCNGFISPEAEHFPFHYLCHVPVSWLTCLCPAAWAPLAWAGARSALTSLLCSCAVQVCLLEVRLPSFKISPVGWKPVPQIVWSCVTRRAMTPKSHVAARIPGFAM